MPAEEVEVAEAVVEEKVEVRGGGGGGGGSGGDGEGDEDGDEEAEALAAEEAAGHLSPWGRFAHRPEGFGPTSAGSRHSCVVAGQRRQRSTTFHNLRLWDELKRAAEAAASLHAAEAALRGALASPRPSDGPDGRGVRRPRAGRAACFPHGLRHRGAEQLIGFFIVVPSAHMYSYFGPAHMTGHACSVQNSAMIPYSRLLRGAARHSVVSFG